MRILTAIALLGAAAFSPAVAQTTSFDGTWSVTQDCEPAPGGARGFKWSYDATVKAGRLVAQYGTKDKPSLTLTGQIQPDGSAPFMASVSTANPTIRLALASPARGSAILCRLDSKQRAAPALVTKGGPAASH